MYLKLTKFRRRSHNSGERLGKIAKGFEFVHYMAKHDFHAIRRARDCLQELAGENVREVSLYGTGDIAEVLYDLTFEFPVKIKAVYGDSIKDRFFGYKIYPTQASAGGEEKLIIASLVALDDKVQRLQELGVPPPRIVLIK
jgi:hypothetical protein